MRFLVLVAAVALSPACQSGDRPYVDVGVPSGRCATCHLPDYLAVNRPAHAGVKPTTCGVCHSTRSWHPAILDHPFALTFAHAKVDCYGCHKGNPTVFQGTPSGCVDCHRKDYDGSRFPGHSRFPLTCADCHSTAAWKPTLPDVAPKPPEQEQPAPAGSSATPAPSKPRTSRTRPSASGSTPRRTPPAPARTNVPPGPAAPNEPAGALPDSVTGASRRRR